eukprot:gi/632968878/ref/XP_007900778.1/ PREDICTED: activity-dependent neuroprotector homeobox protein-like isoform X2 [Callorhinchus milii]
MQMRGRTSLPGGIGRHFVGEAAVPEELVVRALHWREWKSTNPVECNMNITSWTDISVWQPSKKLESYRTKPYCCSLCAFSTTFISAYKSHMRCSHEDEMDVEMMIGCPNCPFVSYPKNMKKHIRMFHSEPRKAHVTNINTDQVSPVQPKILQGKMSNLVKPVYFCRVCHYKNVSMYALKKHVFLSHFGTLVNAYIGEVEPKLVSKDKIPVVHKQKSFYLNKYFCKGCKIKMITYEALIYHILDRHKKVDHQVKAVIGHVSELRTVPPIAPKPLMDQASVAALPSAGPSVQPFKAPPIVRPPDQTQPSVGPPVPLVQTPSSVRPPTPSVQALPITGPPVPLVQVLSRAGPPVPLVPASHIVKPPVLPVQAPPCAGLPVTLVHALPSVGPPLPQVHVPPSIKPSAPPVQALLSAGPPVSSVQAPLNVRQPMPAAPIVRPVPSSVLTVSAPLDIRSMAPTLFSVSPAVPATPSIGPSLSGVPSVQSTTVASPMTSSVPASLQQAINMMALKPVTVGSFLPNVNHFPSQNNTIPVTISTTGPVGAPNATQVNLLSAFQNNLTIRTVGPVLPQAILVPPGLTLDPTMRASVPGNVASTTSQALRQLIQTTSHVNGVPTYTLTPVQFSLPVSSAGMTGGTPGMNSTVQVPMTVTQTNAMTSVSPQQIKEPSPEMTFAFPPVQEQQSEDCVNPPKTQQWKSCSECSELVPLNLFDSHVAVAHNAEKISNKPDKVVASASYLQRVRAQIGKCLFCKSYVHKNVLLSHLLTHGLSCLFCALTFHDLAQLAEHMKSLHAGLKFESVHYIKDGVPTSSQINGGSFNMTITLPEDKMGPNDIHLTLIPNKMSSPHAPLLIEICREKNEATIVKNTPTEEKPDIKCSFCSKLILESKYEKHLHENHQVAPMIHPLLKIPAFKCIHCLGVYTDSMTASTISLHLLHCRGLNKQPILPKSVVQSKREVPDIEKNYTTEILNTESEDLELPPSKRLKVDVGASNHQLSPTSVIDTDPNSQSLPLPDPSTVLALVPKDFENCSYEERKLFLLDYFHKRPYPSNEEVEMLSSILWLWKADVALMFSKKQHLCLRAIKRRKPLVLLGFNMSEMRNVKHSITLGEI